jgi:hypothetical protein
VRVARSLEPTSDSARRQRGVFATLEIWQSSKQTVMKLRLFLEEPHGGLIQKLVGFLSILMLLLSYKATAAVADFGRSCSYEFPLKRKTTK